MGSDLSPVGRFKTLLLATEGTEYSAAAEQMARGFARSCGARLIALRVVVTNPEYEAMAPERVRVEADEAQQYLSALAGGARAEGLEIEPLVRHGADPYMEIVDGAEELNADVIIMGRRTRGDLARLMMGDSTARVIGHAPCSVLVVPRSAPVPDRGVLVATDGSRLADAACVAAARVSQVFDLPLSVLSVVPTGQGAEHRAEAQGAIDRVREALVGEGVQVQGIVEEGRPEQVILEVATREGADLIVLGSHGRTGLQRLLMGSVAERVVGQAEVAVLVVK
jgi:nucleotide-binding universal stress UspA family protein